MEIPHRDDPISSGYRFIIPKDDTEKQKLVRAYFVINQ